MQRVKDESLAMDNEQRCFLDEQPFTGIAFEERPMPDGTCLSEITYANGWQSGVSRDFYPDGRLAAEQWFWEGCQHGWMRRYSSSGSLIEEGLFEFGVPTSPATGEALDPTHAGVLAQSRTLHPDWPAVRG